MPDTKTWEDILGQIREGRVAFEPDYRHIQDAARNRKPARYPLYEHGIGPGVMEAILQQRFYHLFEQRDAESLRRFFRSFNEFWRRLGYDTVTLEAGITSAMPGNGALGAHQAGVIHCRADFDDYPWETIEERYFTMWSEHFRACAVELPDGMRCLGGCGNGVFECVQDIVGYEALCLIRGDDPGLFADLFAAVGRISVNIWRRFLEEFGDAFAVCRFGDDLGFKSATLLSPADIKEHIIPVYKQIVELVHAAGKPFLLHSCGNIAAVMDDLIDTVGIDAKHSNEDNIAPFSTWLQNYGQRIALFGGLDVDVLSNNNIYDVRQVTLDILDHLQNAQGVAIGSGNSIPDYVPVDNYLSMVATVRHWRGDFD